MKVIEGQRYKQLCDTTFPPTTNFADYDFLNIFAKKWKKLFNCMWNDE